MQICQTVFGVFHSFDLARELHRRKHLERIFSTWPWRRLEREGLPHDRVGTFPWIHTPDFLLARFGLMTRWMDDQASYANALAFDEYTLRAIPECDALIAISGSALKTGRLVQRRGGKFICDRGSSHQRFQDELLTEEYRKWKVETPPSDPRDIAREEEIYAEADAISVPSTFAMDSFRRMGVPAGKLHCIPYGVRLERFHPVAEPDPSCFEVLFVGGVSLRKGIPYLLEAFAALRHPRKRLRIVGSMSSEIQKLLPSFPTESVEFLGAVPQSELPVIMSSSHVFVLPSIEDGFGVVMSQAMACGCPVLSSTNTGGFDLYTEGVEGFIVPAGDSSALEDRMKLLMDDPELRKRMSVAALERVKSLGGWSSYGDQWETLLQQLTGKKEFKPL